MADDKVKPLVIDVDSNSQQSGTLNKWEPLGNTGDFIKKIITPPLEKGTNIAQLVSGIPSAFARVNLFRTALDSSDDSIKTDDAGSLISLYTELVNEWRGLIACIALDNTQMSVKCIDLVYSDKKPIEQTENVYEPKGAFGNMLLKRRDLWCKQNLNNNDEKIPFIHVIKYKDLDGKDVVVGATAPESLLFTSTGYKLQYSKDRPWVDSRNGRFTDPLNSTMNENHIMQLYAYIGHLKEKVGDFQNYYHKYDKDFNVNSIVSELKRWEKELEAKASKEGFDLSKGSIPPVSLDFSEPFASLFCSKDELWGREGVISEFAGEGYQPFNPKDLLLGEDAKIARIDIDPTMLDKLPILVLEASVVGSETLKAYFALPLSALGLNVYGKTVSALVGRSNGQVTKSTLTAVYNSSATEKNLLVSLNIETENGKKRSFPVAYTSDGEVCNKDILLWPNFISPQWDQYYMYNELPHNDNTQSFRAIPFVGEQQDNCLRIVLDEKNPDIEKRKQPILLSDIINKKIVDQNNIKAELLVHSSDAVSDNPYKYEIYCSEKPFMGVKLLSSTNKDGGYLLVNYGGANQNTLPVNLMSEHNPLNPVRLGIDFGSTNTSVAYYKEGDSKPTGFQFPNQRVSLMGGDLSGMPRANHVLFFQGASGSLWSNSIRSTLTLHDPRRLPSSVTPTGNIEKAVMGGFPCFSDNLPLTSSDEHKIYLNFAIGGPVTQIHNMKWENDDYAKAYKKAFLKGLLLHIYAALFRNQIFPNQLVWSYPSAMKTNLLGSYQEIWNELGNIAPVLKVENSQLIKPTLNISKVVFNSNTAPRTSLGNMVGGAIPTNTMGGASGIHSFMNGGASMGMPGASMSGTSMPGANNMGGSGIHSLMTGGASMGMPGAQQPQQPQLVDDGFMPDNQEIPVEYKPVPLYGAGGGSSLSEAQAVANKISMDLGSGMNVLDVCFDVGGSTTDISAMFQLMNPNGGQGGNMMGQMGQMGQTNLNNTFMLTMLKQNSLRFAAQRVSQCVGLFPEFGNVLRDVCNQFNIQMQGLNTPGDSLYNERTASYFFDQVVNRLTPEQLPTLYQKVFAGCNRLMSVNLYVTGLLMYYAGEISRKLVDDLNRTVQTERGVPQPITVRISFAGKGARLFKWMSALSDQSAIQYYTELFATGYGRDYLHTLSDFQLMLPQDDNQNVKYEVSKGLAMSSTSLYKPSAEQSAEIIGESGFMLIGSDNQARPVSFTNSVTPQMMQGIGFRFSQPQGYQPKAEKFMEFLTIFYNTVTNQVGWQTNPADLVAGCNNLNVVQYAQNMPEYREALSNSRTNGTFDFVAPVIILEGMQFYETTLLNLLKK